MVVLLSVALLGLGAGSVVTCRKQLNRKMAEQESIWLDWRLTLAADLPRSHQADWNQTASGSPEAMMRACSYVVESSVDSE